MDQNKKKNHTHNKSHKISMRIFSISNLRHVWKRSEDKKAPGLDQVTTNDFKSNLDDEIKKIRDKIYSENYEFSELKVSTFRKSDGGKRVICIPTVADRLVQRVIMNTLIKDKSDNRKDYIKELKLSSHQISYSTSNDIRLDSGVKNAIVAAARIRDKYPFVLKTDIKSFFDDIDREMLIENFNVLDKKSHLYKLIEKVIKCECDDRKTKLLKAHGIQKNKGIRQGMPLSPLLSDIYLRDFDKVISEKIGANKVVRYVDDIVAFASNKEDCEKYKIIIEAELKKINLFINKAKTEVFEPDKALSFLGIEIYKPRKEHKYSLRIGKKKRNKILDDLKEEFNVNYAVKNRITMTKLFQKFNDKFRGYRDYYSDMPNGRDKAVKKVDNVKQFLVYLNAKKEEIQAKLLEEIFGEDSMNKIKGNQDHMRFLGLKDYPSKNDRAQQNKNSAK